MTNTAIVGTTSEAPGHDAELRRRRDAAPRSRYTVVVVNDHGFINGGQAKIAIDSAKALAASGLDVVFFTACGPVDEGLAKAGVEVVCLDQSDILSEPRRLLAAGRGLWNFTAARDLRALLEARDPRKTVVHCHGFAKALSPAIGPVVVGGPWAHVYTCHEYFLACPNGGFYDFQKNEICTRRALGPACLTTNCDVRRPAHKAWRVARQATLWSFGAMPRRLKHVIYVSETQRRVLERYMSPRTSLHYVQNPNTVAAKSRVRAEDNDIFLFVGRLSPEKGATVFARAAKIAGVRAVVIGDGAERAAIAAANPDAEMIGWVQPETVDVWMRQARTLVFPSLWYETDGLVVREALARGVPVICGSWTAAAEMLGGGAMGCLWPSASTSALADCLRAQASNEIIRRQSELAFSRRFFDMVEHVKRLRDIYSLALADIAGARP